MATLKIQPYGKDQGDYVGIEEEDFDPKIHKLYEEGAGEKALSAADLKAYLTEHKVEFKGNASKADLQALYDAHKAAAAE